MRVLTPGDLWAIPRVGAPVTDPRGSVVVVPVTAHDGDEPLTRLWLIDDAGTRPLTGTLVSSTQPAVSPDGRTVAFVRKIDGNPQIHVMPLYGGEARPLTTFPIGATAPRWMPDGEAVLCLGTVYRDALTLEAAAEHHAALEEPQHSARTTEGRFFRYWDRWLTEGAVPHLFKVDTATGEATDLTPASTVFWEFDNTGNPQAQFDVHPDGREIVFSASRTDDPDVRPTPGIYVLPVGGTPTLIPATGEGGAVRPRYILDGTAILYGRRERPDFYADRNRLVRRDRASGEEVLLLEAWDRSPSGWEPIGDGGVVFTAEDDAGTQLYRLAPGAETPDRLSGEGTAASVAVGGDNLYYQLHSLTSPTEVHRWSPAGSTAITAFASASLQDVELGEVESVRYTGAEGDEVQMFVVTPPGFDATRRWPLVHLIHGGPHGVFGDSWHWRWNAQVVAAAGYVVALVNFHGSTSWGQSYGESILGRWGDQPFHDVEAATDLLIARGSIDASRLAVTGGSYGGYLTAWITSQTDRYRCAVAHAAVTNLAGMYASDLVFHRATAYGAEYWDDPARVDRWNPAAQAGGYSTPTLVIHGELDYRVPATQGLELYGVLKSKGVEARLVYYPDENHWILKKANSLHWYGEFLGWLNRHLGSDD